MKRRSLLKSAGAGAGLAIAGFPHIAKAQAPVVLKFSTFQPSTSYTWRTLLKPWMDKVELESQGRIKFEAYPAMQLGGTAAQLYDHARDGLADVVWTLPGYSSGRFPSIEAFELPFMMNNAASTSQALWEFARANAQDEFKETHLLALHVHGPGVIHMTNANVTSPADLKGKKVRGPTRQVTKLLRSVGAAPVGMLLPQIPDALTKGTIDGCVLNWEVVPVVKVQELTKHHCEFAPTKPAMYTTTFAMTMNKARYESLPADLRKVIDANSGAGTSAQFGKLVQDGDVNGRQSALDRGNTIQTLTNEQTDAFIKASSSVSQEWVDEISKRGRDGAQLVAKARELIAKYA